MYKCWTNNIQLNSDKQNIKLRACVQQKKQVQTTEIPYKMHCYDTSYDHEKCHELIYFDKIIF